MNGGVVLYRMLGEGRVIIFEELPSEVETLIFRGNLSFLLYESFDKADGVCRECF